MCTEPTQSIAGVINTSGAKRQFSTKCACNSVFVVWFHVSRSHNSSRLYGFEIAECCYWKFFIDLGWLDIEKETFGMDMGICNESKFMTYSLALLVWCNAYTWLDLVVQSKWFRSKNSICKYLSWDGLLFYMEYAKSVWFFALITPYLSLLN